MIEVFAKKIKHRFLFVLFLVSFSNFVIGQNKIDSIQNLISKEKNEIKKANLMIKFLDYIYDNDFQLVTKNANIIISIGKKNRIDTLIAKAYYYKGLSANNFYKFELSTRYLDSSLSIYYLVKDTLMIVRVLNAIGNNFFDNQKYSNSIEKLSISIQLAHKKKYNSELAEAYNIMGLIFCNVGNLDKALNFFNKCIEIDSISNNFMGLGKTYNNIGRTYAMKNDYQNTIFYYNKSFEFLSKINDTTNLAVLLMNIGNTFLQMKEFDKVLNYYFKSFELRKKTNDKRGMGNVMLNISAYYLSLKNLDSALFYSNEAYKLYVQAGNVDGIAKSYSNIAIIYRDMKQYPKAMIYVKKSIEISEKNNDVLGLALSYVVLGRLFNKQKLYKKAIECFNKSKEYAKSIGNKKIIADCYLLIGECFENINDYKKACSNYKNYILILDSIYNENIQKQVIELQTKYEVNQKDFEIELLDKKNQLKEIENEKKQQKILQQKTVIIMSFLLLFIALASIILIIRLYNIKKRANFILEKQNDEIKSQKEIISYHNIKLEQMNAELHQQKEYIAIQRDEIEKELKETLLKSEILKRENLQFQLEALKNQLNPHFLFNTFSTLISLISENQQIATKYVMQLSNVYRYILMSREKELIELWQELEFIEAYMFLVSIRFDNNVQLNLNIDQNHRNSYIPLLTLQLLVENAIKHNIISDKKTLNVQIYTTNNKLIVKNNIQKKSSLEPSTKVGLQNIQKRYLLLTNKEIKIFNNDIEFIVELPLISNNNL